MIMEWISVDDRLPKYNIRGDGVLVSSKLLCYCENCKTIHICVSQKFYFGKRGETLRYIARFYDAWGDEIENVSHWMPLPKLPNATDTNKQTCIEILNDLLPLLDYETQYKPLLDFIESH